MLFQPAIQTIPRITWDEAGEAEFVPGPFHPGESASSTEMFRLKCKEQNLQPLQQLNDINRKIYAVSVLKEQYCNQRSLINFDQTAGISLMMLVSAGKLTNLKK